MNNQIHFKFHFATAIGGLLGFLVAWLLHDFYGQAFEQCAAPGWNTSGPGTSWMGPRSVPRGRSRRDQDRTLRSPAVLPEKREPQQGLPRFWLRFHHTFSTGFSHFQSISVYRFQKMENCTTLELMLILLNQIQVKSIINITHASECFQNVTRGIKFWFVFLSFYHLVSSFVSFYFFLGSWTCMGWPWVECHQFLFLVFIIFCRYTF